MNPFTILLVDDEEPQLVSLKRFLTRRGFEVITTQSGKEAYKIAQTQVVDLVLTDYRMPEWSGLDVLKNIKELNPEIDVVIMTAFGSIEDAVDIMKTGAYDYLTKPVDLDQLENLLKRVQEKRILLSENKVLREQLRERFKFESVVSQSSEMEKVLNTASRVAASKATILILGESGTGKELIARAIHFSGPKKDRPFVVVNAAALPESLIESELFGHEKGAFTGAAQQRSGRFEQADGGTLFIDEVGDIPVAVQVKLLRAIQFGQFERLGGNKTLSVDTRILTATNKNLEELIAANLFREDLYYRLNVIRILIPPLKRRKSDILPLISHFITKYAVENEKHVEGIDRDALDRLMKYDFPGNVRELENIIEHAVVMCRGQILTIEDLPQQVNITSSKTKFDPANLDQPYEEKMNAFETEMIRSALEQSGGNQSAAARMLDITERHFRSRLEKLGMKKNKRPTADS